VAKKDYDAIVVGSGPNGLSAAITLQREGLSVLLLEGKNTIGGGMRTEELTLPGFKHDICSAIHPMASDSGFFQSLPLHDFGLEYITPPIAFAHPLDDGTAGAAYNSLDETVEALGEDGRAYRNLMEPVIRDWRYLEPDLFAPLHFPNHFLHTRVLEVMQSDQLMQLPNGLRQKKQKPYGQVLQLIPPYH